MLRHIEQTIKLDPDAGYVLLMDNLNTHCSATLSGEALVARLCNLKREDFGEEGKQGGS